MISVPRLRACLRQAVWLGGGLLMAAWVSATAAAQTPIKVTLDDASGLPRLIKGGQAMSSQYKFFSANWQWADQTLFVDNIQGYARRFTGKNESLAMTLQGQLSQPSEQSLRWQWTYTATRPMKDVAGGMEFAFDLKAYGESMGEPEILSGRRGWAWGKAAERVEMRFDPPLADVYFERGNKAQLRALFIKDALKPGSIQHTATLSLGTAASLQLPTSQRHGLEAAPSWPLMKMDSPEVAIDLSFLNAADRPAGRRGAVQLQGERLTWPDGTAARFWGTNLSAYTLFTTPRDKVPQQARRLARLGFNLVRLHHHDSPWVVPNVFGDDKQTNTRRINANAREQLDWWVKCLQDEGIYLWIDLHVQRHFKAGDGIEHFTELPEAYGAGNRDLKGFNYVNRSIEAAMQQFAQDYLSAVNPHTKKRLLDDPAVIAVQITNENDITHHFGNSLLPKQGAPRHAEIYSAASDAFADKHDLSKRKTWRAWEPGPSKLFLNDLEQAFHRRFIDRLRSLGLKAAISTTSQWGDNPLSSIPALTTGELIDAHAYAIGDELERDPRYKQNIAHYLAMSQTVGRPFSVSEWNMATQFAPDRHTLPLYIASQSAHQGWDAVLQYAYAQVALNHDGQLGDWSAFNDPAQLVPMAAAALMYRQGHVREAQSTYVFTPTPDQLFGTDVSADTAPALRVAAERGKLQLAMPATRELPWLKADAVPANATRITDPQALTGVDANRISSDHGELMRDWQAGVYTVRTPRSQAALGWIGGRTHALPDMEVTVKAPYASVSVHSLDGQPIREAKELLIAVSAVSLPAREEGAQFRSQALDGELRIRAPAGLQLFTGTDSLTRATVQPTRGADGRYTIELGAQAGARWLVLRTER